jgi:predicted RNase H-like HicB family nuclease
MDEPDFFGFYSPDLEGFTCIGHSIEDCLYKAKWGTKEHADLLRDRGLPIPEAGTDPQIVPATPGKPCRLDRPRPRGILGLISDVYIDPIRGGGERSCHLWLTRGIG